METEYNENNNNLETVIEMITWVTLAIICFYVA